jgi:acetylornithine deacetylase/succinyl-diaminopimelate desuccinylase-like protein
MTDARHYDDLGIQTYGFLPIAAPSRLPSELLHAPDERVSVAALERGAAALESVIERIALRSGGIDKRAVAQITFRAERSRVKR